MKLRTLCFEGDYVLEKREKEKSDQMVEKGGERQTSVGYGLGGSVMSVG
ncbi:hypothetical protein IMSAGC001_03180 [Bacteroides acidifaciens]|jgi:hypothetical protein|uniref:Uncharacterized protein n=1 Tax=Bacteroides acidifaciens TaxID=85831 RepID=A0A7J0A740_9BACE|nr:hypothetical protein IMSAGC001_03180 [Bacteroides acidifaciens]